jgi:hypothetical protein
MPAPLTVTRSARWVSNYANVPRLGLRPILLLDLAKPQVHATLDTQRTLLVAFGFSCEQNHPLTFVWTALQAIKKIISRYQTREIRRPSQAVIWVSEPDSVGRGCPKPAPPGRIGIRPQNHCDGAGVTAAAIRQRANSRTPATEALKRVLAWAAAVNCRWFCRPAFRCF